MPQRTRHWDRTGNGGLTFTELGFGTAPLGNLYRAISEDDAQSILDRAWEAGVDATLYVEEDMFHAWASVAPNHPVSKRTFMIVANWIESHRSCDANS